MTNRIITAGQSFLADEPTFTASPSPLSYPGGKSRAIPLIAPLILEGMKRAGTNELVSPFFGGGNLELACAENGARVFGSDIFGSLVNFWNCLARDPEGVADKVQDYLTNSANASEFDAKKFSHLQKVMPKSRNGIAKAAAFYALNKLSFCGATVNGGMNDPSRLNNSGIEKLRLFDASNVSVELLDFETALKRHPDAFGYFDPPYDFEEAARNSLYGVQGAAHRNFDHDRLFRAIQHRPNWIMSYNADSPVLARYQGFPMVFPKWAYGMGGTKDSNEVLIFSRDLSDLAGVAQRWTEEDAQQRKGAYFTANDTGGASWSSPDLTVCAEAQTPAPVFPRGVLGSDWAKWCADVASGANAHFDYVAATLLTATAGLIGNSTTVRATKTFVQPSILWTCLVGKSGAGKTPATAIIGDIVNELERSICQRNVLRDVTVAASVKLAADNPKGLLLFRDELSGWWTNMRRTGGEDFWLEAYNGKRFTKDRKNDEPVVVDRLSISVIGGAQPSTVRDITTDGKNRGFSARWLFAYPEPVLGYADEDVPVDVEWATKSLARLADLPVDNGCLPLTASGQIIFSEWWNAKRIENADHDGLWAEWMSKQGGNALRIALCLELLKWSATDGDLPHDISEQSLRDAVKLIDHWAIPMAERTLEVMHRSQSDQLAATLAKHLRRAKLATFNSRKLRRGEYGQAGALSDSSKMDDACAALIEARLIRHVGARAHARKGRISGDYEVNPALVPR